MINIADERRIGDFMDKWRQAFRSDADLDAKTQKAEAFFTEAEELQAALIEAGGVFALTYALRVVAGIPGLTAGLERVFKADITRAMGPSVKDLHPENVAKAGVSIKDLHPENMKMTGFSAAEFAAGIQKISKGDA